MTESSPRIFRRSTRPTGPQHLLGRASSGSTATSRTGARPRCGRVQSQADDPNLVGHRPAPGDGGAKVRCVTGCVSVNPIPWPGRRTVMVMGCTGIRRHRVRGASGENRSLEQERRRQPPAPYWVVEPATPGTARRKPARATGAPRSPRPQACKTQPSRPCTSPRESRAPSSRPTRRTPDGATSQIDFYRFAYPLIDRVAERVGPVSASGPVRPEIGRRNERRSGE